MKLSLNVALIMGLALAATSINQIKCQVEDGDEQFSAYHGDIGRISAGNVSPVGPQTTIVARQPQQQPPPQQHQQQPQFVATEPLVAASPPALPLRASQVLDRSRSRHQQQVVPVQASAPVAVAAVLPKRNRITLAVRRDPESSTLLDGPADASQLVAPPHQAAPHFHQQQQPQLAPVAVQVPSGSSVTPRHSALIAQVAAERQAESAGSSAFVAPNFGAPQPSLGSPLEAVSAPVNSQNLQPLPLASQSFGQAQAVAAATAPALNFVNQPEEPIVAPSFEQVLGGGCPPKGVFSYENKDHCDRYYMCTNGTFTEEACPNGLAYSQQGAVYQHCAYNWNVDCGNKKSAEPLASPGCPWQFGIFPIASAGRCSIDYFACEWGVPETKRCSPEGLFYDDRIKGCQWADQLGCKSEALLNFKCPTEDEENPYWPFPRYYHTNRDVIVCVNEQPRLVHCNEEQLVDSGSLACIDIKKKKKKF